jgi:hypothetical protein
VPFNAELGTQRALIHSAPERPAVTAADLRSPAMPPAPKNERSSATSTEARALAMREGHSLANKEVATILENSLGDEPHRVDIGIKLLEIYHHEARGNRAEFNAMLSKLVADPQALTPAQRSHVEKLQRTLSDDESSIRTEFVAKVAI